MQPASDLRETSRCGYAAGCVSADELVDQVDELELAGLPFSAVVVVTPPGLQS